MSPQQLLMPSLKMDQRIFVTNPELTGNSVSDYAKELFQLQEIAIAVAQETQSARDSVNIRKRTHGATTIFPVNSFVLKAYPYTRMGKLPPTKLHLGLKGPLKVVKINGPQYTLLDVLTNKEEPPCHVSRLREYKHDEASPEPREVAMADNILWDVEKILAMNGSFSRKTELKFQVKWTGFEDQKDYTWEPWSFLRTNEVLHAWMTAHNLKSHIPKNIVESMDVDTHEVLVLEEYEVPTKKASF